MVFWVNTSALDGINKTDTINIIEEILGKA